MNLALNNVVTDAARNLAGNPQWEKLCAGLGDVADAMVDRAIGSDPALRMEATAYARALRDIWVQLEAATKGLQPKVVPRRTTVGKGDTDDADGETEAPAGKTRTKAPT